MAIYRAHVKVFSRGKGSSSIAVAACRAGLCLRDERTGLWHDYRRRGGVEVTKCIAPEGSPEWSVIPAQLWVAVEQAERRKDATVAREFEIAMPNELSCGQREALAWEIAEILVSRYKFAAQASLHAPDFEGVLSWHLHILVTTRRIDKQGFSEKTRELDGGPSGKIEVQWIREMIARVINAHLEAAKLDVRVEHRRISSSTMEALVQGDINQALALSRPSPTPDEEKKEQRRRLGDRSKNVDAVFDAALRKETKKIRKEKAEKISEPTSIVTRKRGEGISFDLGGSGCGRIEGLHGWGSYDPLRPWVRVERQKVTNSSLMEKVQGLWKDSAVVVLHNRLSNTQLVLEKDGEWLSTHFKEICLGVALRKILRELQSLKRLANEWKRRERAAVTALDLLNRAQSSLTEFLQARPRSSEKNLADWDRQNGRRLATIDQRLGTFKKAHASVSTEEQQACEDRLNASVARLEEISQKLRAAATT